MIKFKLKELLARQEFDTSESISIIELSKMLDISKNTLYRIANSKGSYNTTTENIEKLCNYFNCTPNEFMIFVPDKSDGGKQVEKTDG